MQRPLFHLHLPLVALLLAAGLAGCSQPMDVTAPMNGNGTEQAPAALNALPTMHLGDRYHYRSDTGTLLNVTVDHIGPARHPDGTSEEAVHLLLEATFNGSIQGTYRFQEAISLASKALIHQSAECDALLGREGEIQCYSPERGLVLYGVAGLPGAMGASVFWNGTPASPWQAAGVDVAVDQIRHTYEPLEVDGRPCTLVAPSVDAYVQTLRALPWVVLSTRFVMCPDAALPTVFTPTVPLHPAFEPPGQAKSATYFLHHFEQGTVPVEFPPTKPPQAPQPVVPLASKSPKIHYVPDQPRLHNMTIREAHEAALELSSAYAKIFEDPKAQLAEGFLRASGYAYIGDDTTHVTDVKNGEVFLHAVDPQGNGAFILMEHKRTLVAGQFIEDYTFGQTLTRTHAGMYDPAPVARQVNISAAMAHAKSFTLTNLSDSAPTGFARLPWQHEYMDFRQLTSRTASGFEVWVGLEDFASDGQVAVTPYVVYDGPTGRLLSAVIPNADRHKIL